MTHLFETHATELDSWENEGGGIPAPSARISKAAPWAPASTLAAPARAGAGADAGIVDTHTLKILRMSLVLVVPLLAGLALFWTSALPR